VPFVEKPFAPAALVESVRAALAAPLAGTPVPRDPKS